jgi:hypothetical protein
MRDQISVSLESNGDSIESEEEREREPNFTGFTCAVILSWQTCLCLKDLHTDMVDTFHLYIDWHKIWSLNRFPSPLQTPSLILEWVKNWESRQFMHCFTGSSSREWLETLSLSFCLFIDHVTKLTWTEELKKDWRTFHEGNTGSKW